MNTEAKMCEPTAERLTLAAQQENHTQALGRLGDRVRELEDTTAKLYELVEELRRETGLS